MEAATAFFDDVNVMSSAVSGASNSIQGCLKVLSIRTFL
jgi:hypothetical protein